ncbi:MAG: hypothetical protein RLZZ148_1739 [Cyanobacteriota bacterium]
MAQEAKSSPLIDSPTNFVTDVVERVGPAVVRINASRTVTTQAPQGFDDPMFRQFFGGQMPSMPEKQTQRGIGSGFIMNTKGDILTNAHVVEGANQVTVTLKDGRTFDGQVVGADPLTDIAVVKIKGENLPIVSLGDSEALQVGEWAIAIGNPLGLDNTVTTGIISAKGRSSSQVGSADKRVDFLQTDAAINPGNSGGPLLNAQGEVIGVNTAIIQNAQGLGFAIPISKAKVIAEQLIATGKVEHSYLGIQMVQLTEEIKDQLKESKNIQVEESEGILIIGVGNNSPAEQAGLKAGDVIKTINGEKITDPNKLQLKVESTPIGTMLPLEVSRNGKSVDVEVKVGSFPTKQG